MLLILESKKEIKHTDTRNNRSAAATNTLKSPQKGCDV
jgi:hypothetical protein